jgi:hypothetical protein
MIETSSGEALEKRREEERGRMQKTSARSSQLSEEKGRSNEQSQ